MNIEIPDIVIKINENIEKSLSSEIDDFLKENNVNYKIDITPDLGPFAGIEWLLPSAIGILIGGIFDNSTIIRNSDTIKRLMFIFGSKIFKEKTIQIKYIATENAPDKISKKYSPALSLLVKGPLNRTYKFIFPTDISICEYTASVERIFDFVKSKPEMMRIVEENKNIVINNMIVCTYDRDKNEIIALNPLKK